MGCDIHCYIEYRDAARPGDHWWTFGGRINPGRNYDLFAALAGVRGEGPEPKGLPPGKLGIEAESDNMIYVTPDLDNQERGDGISPDTAAKWVAQGISRWARDDKLFVTHPDYHSHSWATLAELKFALATALEGEDYSELEYECVIAVMEHLESRGQEVRLVYWFDN